MKKLTNCYLDDDIYVPASALCVMLGVAERSIGRYAADGMPFTNIGEAKQKHFPVLKCVEWLAVKGLLEIKQPIPERSSGDSFDDMDSMEARRRQDIAKAKLMEMEVEEAEGKLIRVEDALKENEKVLTAFRSRILSMPSSIAPSVITCETVAEAKSIIENACYDALEELARLE
jgi:phage terminase Nu1 subunit (DNA packaging protein)